MLLFFYKFGQTYQSLNIEKSKRLIIRNRGRITNLDMRTFSDSYVLLSYAKYDTIWLYFRMEIVL